MLKTFEDLRKLRAGDGRPADDSANNGKFLREVQQGLGLRKRLPCLNGDASLYSGRGRALAGDLAEENLWRLAPCCRRSSRSLLSNSAIDGGGRLFDQSWFWAFGRMNLRRRLKRRTRPTPRTTAWKGVWCTRGRIAFRTMLCREDSKRGHRTRRTAFEGAGYCCQPPPRAW